MKYVIWTEDYLFGQIRIRIGVEDGLDPCGPTIKREL